MGSVGIGIGQVYLANCDLSKVRVTWVRGVERVRAVPPIPRVSGAGVAQVNDAITPIAAKRLDGVVPA